MDDNFKIILLFGSIVLLIIIVAVVILLLKKNKNLTKENDEPKDYNLIDNSPNVQLFGIDSSKKEINSINEEDLAKTKIINVTDLEEVKNLVDIKNVVDEDEQLPKLK